jgi:hypothetical protein
MPEDNSRHDGLRNKLDEFAARNPHVTPMDLLTEAFNVAGSQDPTQLLQDSNEPSLQREAAPEFEAYRFYCSWQGARHPRIIRVERSEGTCRLVAKSWEGFSATNEDIWEIAVDRPIDESEFQAIASQIANGDFWKARHCESESVALGAVHKLIEGRKGSVYHSVSRSGTLPSGLGVALELADRLAGFGIE